MRTTTTSLWPGIEMEFEQGGEWITSDSLVADEMWRHVDSNGHGHFWDGGFPTLTWIAEPCTMGHGDDCTAEGHYECTICGETIRPGTRPAEPVWVPGVSRYTMTVHDAGRTDRYVFGGDEMERLNEAVREVVRTVLVDRLVETTIVAASR